MTGALDADQHRPALARRGDTCWRTAQAGRVSFIANAANYFAAVKEAVASAQTAVYLIGWDFDLRIRLRPDEPDPDIPDELRHFLSWVVEEKPGLQIYILQWDGAMLLNIARQIAPFVMLKASRKSKIHFRLDSEHPAGACHHQKIVVIDDSIAFCGGIDMTTGRWDTAEHLPQDERRRSPDGTLLGPWHDVTMAVDGDAARALGELARKRWHRATGANLPVPQRRDVWPDTLPVSCRDVGVGIARTMPRGKTSDGAEEIERLWLAAIEEARHTIYIENQFLAATAIGQALEARLAEADGPDVVIVVPRSAESWLESEVMDSARAFVVAGLRKADKHKRLGVYYPVNAEEEEVYVHAKVLVVDDWLIRIGSSNISNRSMRLDSECDLVVEAGDRADVRKAITEFRDDLLAEHLGRQRAEIAAEIKAAGGRLLSAVEAMRKDAGRPTLRHLPPRELNDVEIALVESRLFDPERPAHPEGRAKHFAKRVLNRYRSEAAVAGAAAGTAAIGAALLIAWRSRSAR